MEGFAGGNRGRKIIGPAWPTGVCCRHASRIPLHRAGARAGLVAGLSPFGRPQCRRRRGPARGERFADEHTHTTPEGADLNAACVLAGIKAWKKSPPTGFLSEKGKAVPGFVDAVK
jgi:hypothetical protein